MDFWGFPILHPHVSKPSRNSLSKASEMPRPQDFDSSVIEEWVSECRPISSEELMGVAKFLRKNRRFTHALEVFKWMGDMKHFDMTPEFAALQLGLTSKVHGGEQAESCFNSLDAGFHGLPVYGSFVVLLCDGKISGQGRSVMEEIRKLGSPNSLNYANMLALYSQMRKYEKLNSLVQEMEENGIPKSEFTYCYRLNACATMPDIEAVEKLLVKMEADPLVTVSAFIYASSAKRYIKAGALEEALMLLKRCEHLIRGHGSDSQYRALMSVYTTMEKEEDVYHIRNLLKKDLMPLSNSYRNV